MAEIKENEIAKEMLSDLIRERRAERRWKNIRFFVWLFLILYILGMIWSQWDKSSTSSIGSKYVALIRIDGMIAPERDFSAQELIPTLRKAFKDKNAAGVIIDINSPGGTPVQASIIHDAILALKQKYKKRVVVVGEDLLTSGAYYVAVAADKIYVNPNTITGSVGVIMKGFGFVDMMKKIGVERRVYTAGNDKDRLDPFLPQTESDTKKIQQVINEIHQNFVNAVLKGRANKLHGEPEVLFSGDFWSGTEAVKLGLVDGLGNLLDVMTTEFKTTAFQEYKTSTGLFHMLGGQLNSAFDAMFYSTSNTLSP